MSILTALGLLAIYQPLAIADAPPAPETNLGKLTVEYYNLSINLENQMKVVGNNVVYCNTRGLDLANQMDNKIGAKMFSSKMAIAVQAQSGQRSRIYTVLSNSQKAMNDQIAAVTKTVGGQADAGKAAIDSAKGAISSGIDTPFSQLTTEMNDGTPYLQQMEESYNKAMYVLSDNNGQQCTAARNAFSAQNPNGVFVTAHKIRDKVNEIRAALAGRKKELLAWADQIKTSLVAGSGSVAIAKP